MRKKNRILVLAESCSRCTKICLCRARRTLANDGRVPNRQSRVLTASRRAHPQSRHGANGPHRWCPHSLSYRSSSSTTAPAPRGRHKPERIDHYELLPRRLGNPTKGACPCRSARTRATPAAAAPARQRASKRHAGWLSRVWAVPRGTVRRWTRPRPRPHTHTHTHTPTSLYV